MNIEGKTISTVRRHQDTGTLRVTFTDGAATDLELDSFRLVRIVPVYPSDRDLMPLSADTLDKLREQVVPKTLAEHAASWNDPAAGDVTQATISEFSAALKSIGEFKPGDTITGHPDGDLVVVTDPLIVEMLKAEESTPASALDSQVAGDHYKKLGMYQPWQVLAAWMTPEELKGAAKKDAIGYLAREADKGGREDIEKAVHTLQIYLELTK